MKIFIVSLCYLFLINYSWGQTPLQEWEELAKRDIRLLPKYGHKLKNNEQKTSDSIFIASTLKIPDFQGNRTIASNHMINLGFRYVARRDLKTAMYRFNQAYLLDSTNTDIYWGYGVIYMTLGDFEAGKKLYEEGLALNPKNTNLLTDYGTYFLGQYYKLQNTKDLEEAMKWLLKAYQLNKTNDDTNFKLSICYWLKKDCENAWKYLDQCKDLDSKPNGYAYKADLENVCKKKKK